MINGYQNEYIFVKYLNGKKYEELNVMFKSFIDELYGNILNGSIISSYINPLPQKIDFYIEINGIKKGISLKKGIKNSVHVERISDFIHFLIENHVERESVIGYLKYQYADGSVNGKGEKRMSVAEYKLKYQNEIDVINKSLNNPSFVKHAINRFILKGNNSSCGIDAIIYGTLYDFVWILSEDIIRIILSSIDNYSTAVHIGPLTVQPKNRCLNYNPLYEKDRYCVQIKWYNIFDDIIKCMNDKTMK